MFYLQLLGQAMEELAAKYSSYTVIRTSVLEKSGDAFLISDSVATPHSVAKSTKREIAHVHAGTGSGDYSLHMSLSPADCKEVISKKWGESNDSGWISGTAGVLVSIYA